mgnify:CR=1 FL=1
MKVVSIKPNISGVQKTSQYIVDQGITYNEAGLTYNEALIMYGGLAIQGLFSGVSPNIAKVANSKSHISFINRDIKEAQFYRGSPYGLLLMLTYPD